MGLIHLEAKKDIKTKKIIDAPLNTYLEFMENAVPNERYMGVIFETSEGKRVLYEVQEGWIYDDIENYSIVEEDFAYDAEDIANFIDIEDISRLFWEDFKKYEETGEQHQ